MSVPQIAIFPETELTSRARLLDAVAELYSVRFVAGDSNQLTYNAAILFSATPDEALAWADRGARCLAFLNGPARAMGEGAVSFRQSAHISPLFRGTRFSDRSITSVVAVQRQPDHEIVADRGGEPFWLHCRRGNGAADLVASSAPVLEASEYLYQYFGDDQWAALLPLLHFVAEVSGWAAPPLRACFMFDDPNLHWGSYGYVKYREIAEAARAQNYHASFATVPMDAWFVHSSTARLFRDNARHLSLLVHGNDHTRLELHQPQHAAPIALAAQALDRISRLEQKSGLSVARVMAAPHGACSEEAASALSKTGFDAACISRGSLMSRNPGVAWPVSVGMAPAEMFGALPVIPRISIDLDSDVPARLAGFLGQPIIPVGHHHDLRTGLALLSRSAQFINSIGPVEWMDMRSIAELNYFSRVRGSVLEVRLYSRRVRITVPGGVTQVVLRRPWLAPNTSETVVLQSPDGSVVRSRSYDGELIDVIEGDAVVRAVETEAVDLTQVSVPRPPVRAIIRRQLCEARDRLRPAFDRLIAASK